MLAFDCWPYLKLFLQAEQMHKMTTIISLKIVEVVIFSENSLHVSVASDFDRSVNQEEEIMSTTLLLPHPGFQPSYGPVWSVSDSIIHDERYL